MAPTIVQYQNRLVNTTITATTLRNQGASNVVESARIFLRPLDLAPFAQAQTERNYLAVLNKHTDALKMALPLGAQHFGTARKALNLYLGEAYYNQFVCQYYGLDRVAKFLEVPLDAMVTDYLSAASKRQGTPLPAWKGIKHLCPDHSALYQEFAAHYAAAKGEGFYRVHIDLLAWGPSSEPTSRS